MDVQEVNRQNTGYNFFKPLSVYHSEFKKTFHRLPHQGKLKRIIWRIMVVVAAPILYPTLILFGLLAHAVISSFRVKKFDQIALRQRQFEAEQERQRAKAPEQEPLRARAQEVVDEVGRSLKRSQAAADSLLTVHEALKPLDDLFAKRKIEHEEYEAQKKEIEEARIECKRLGDSLELEIDQLRQVPKEQRDNTLIAQKRSELKKVRENYHVFAFGTSHKEKLALLKSEKESKQAAEFLANAHRDLERNKAAASSMWTTENYIAERQKDKEEWEAKEAKAQAEYEEKQKVRKAEMGQCKREYDCAKAKFNQLKSVPADQQDKEGITQAQKLVEHWKQKYLSFSPGVHQQPKSEETEKQVAKDNASAKINVLTEKRDEIEALFNKLAEEIEELNALPADQVDPARHEQLLNELNECRKNLGAILNQLQKQAA